MFPDEHDDIIRLLLFRLAEWHALAKLRLHTDDSLDKLDQALKALGRQLRRFQQFTCSAFQAMELPREVAARQKRQDTNFQSTNGGGSTSGARPKSFNILTYKLHALGDYTASIRLFGTTDSYTTQIVGISCLAILAVLTRCVYRASWLIVSSKCYIKAQTSKILQSSWLGRNEGALASDGNGHQQPSFVTYTPVSYRLKPIIFYQAIDATTSTWPLTWVNTKTIQPSK